MVNTSDHITITVDEDALRAQIRTVIQEELAAASLSLRIAADSLDPEFMPRLREAERAMWEREQADARAANSEEKR